MTGLCCRFKIKSEIKNKSSEKSIRGMWTERGIQGGPSSSKWIING
jgi:hypothetical protein